MNILSRYQGAIVLMGIILVPVRAATGATFIWTNSAANWSANTSWSPNGQPGSADDVKFFDLGTSGTVSNINNTLNGNYTLKSFQFGNTNNFHTTLIPASQTLNITGSGGFSVGTGTDNGNAQTVSATVTGAGVMLVSNSSATISVGQGTASANGSQRATLDLSGLSSFTAEVSRLLIGVEGTYARQTATLYLGQTNYIRVTGSSPAINIGDNNGNGGGTNYLYLGRTNTILADSITVGRYKASGNILGFNSAVTNLNPFAYFRGVSSSRISTLAVSDHSTASGSSTASTSGEMDFTGGTVDLMADTVYLAKTRFNISGTPTSTATLTFNAGTVDVNTLYAGYQSTNNAAVATGIVNVGGAGTLIINSVAELGHFAGTGGASGTLNITGSGQVRANTITNGGGTATVTITNGTLILTNTAGTPDSRLSNLSLTNSTLQLSIASVLTNICVTNLTTGGTTNRFNIATLPVISSFPTQFTLIKYSGSIAGTGFNFGVSSIASGYLGYISNRTADTTITLVVTNSTATKLAITTINNGNPPAADTPFSIVVQAQDPAGNARSVTADTAISISLNTGTGPLGGTITGTITTGTSSATISGITYTKAESGVILTATRTSGNTLTAGNSSSFTVTAGAFAKLQLLLPGETAAPGTPTGKTGTPTTQTAGVAFNVTINAVDAYWNLINTNDAVSLVLNGSTIASALLISGTRTFSQTLTVAGTNTYSTSNLTHPAITGDTSPTMTVNPGPFVKLQLLVPGETASPGSGSGKTGTPNAQTAGTAFNVTVNAVDANWNLVTTNDTVGITSSDSNATLPSNAALSSGTRTFSVTLNTAGTSTVTATDITNGAITNNTSPSITVNVGALHHFGFAAIGAQTARSAFNVIIMAQDAGNNTVSSFSGTVDLTTTAGTINPTVSSAFSSGVRTQSVTVTQTGSGKTITATKTSGLETGSSAAFTVNAGAAATLRWLGNISGDWDIATSANWINTSSSSSDLFYNSDIIRFDDSATGPTNVSLTTALSPASITVSNATKTYTLSGSGKLSGSMSLTKTNSGTLILANTGTNDFTGGITLGAGTLQIGNNDTSGSVGSGNITATATGTTLAFNRTDAFTLTNTILGFIISHNILVNSGTLTLAGTADNEWANATVASNAVLILAKTSSASVHAIGGGNGLTINPGGIARLGGSGGDQIANPRGLTNNGTFDLNALSEAVDKLYGTGVITNTGASTGTLTIGTNNGSSTFGGLIANGSGAGTVALAKNGSGTFILNGSANNTFTGGLSLAGGTLQIGNNDASGSLGFGPVTATASGTTLAFNRTDSITVTNTITGSTISHNVVVNSGTVTLAGTVDNAWANATVASNAVLVLAKTSSASVHAIGGGNGLTINPGGIARLGGSGGDQIANSRNLTNNGTFDLNALGEAVDKLYGTGVITNTGASTGTLTIGTNNGSSTFGGTFVNGTGAANTALTKSGSGTLTLSGANTHTGTTTISAGTLALSGSGSVSNSTNLIVASGATLNASDRTDGTLTLGQGQTLKGNGTITGNLVVSSNATVSPGASPGTLFTGNETWAGGGNYTWEINDTAGTEGTDPGWDLLDSSGALTITATSGNKFNVNITSLNGGTPGAAANFSAASGYTWRIFKSTSAITGFDSAAFSLNSTMFSNSIVNGGGSGVFNLSLTNSSQDLILTFCGYPAITTQPASITNNPGTTANFSVTATGGFPAYQWRKDGTNLTSATSSSLSLTNVQLADAGAYTVVLSNAAGSVTSAVASLTVNAAPSAAADTLERDPYQGVKVRTTMLLANDTDANGDAFNFVSADSSSAQGGAISVLNSTWVRYTPPAGFTNSDSFFYVLADTHNLQATGSVAINLRVDLDASRNVLATNDLGGGVTRVRFTGLPGRAYTVQYTTNLVTPNWQSLGATNANSSGQFEFTDNHGEGAPARFYRTTQP